MKTSFGETFMARQARMVVLLVIGSRGISGREAFTKKVSLSETFDDFLAIVVAPLVGLAEGTPVGKSEMLSVNLVIALIAIISCTHGHRESIFFKR